MLLTGNLRDYGSISGSLKTLFCNYSDQLWNNLICLYVYRRILSAKVPGLYKSEMYSLCRIRKSDDI